MNERRKHPIHPVGPVSAAGPVEVPIAADPVGPVSAAGPVEASTAARPVGPVSAAGPSRPGRSRLPRRLTVVLVAGFTVSAFGVIAASVDTEGLARTVQQVRGDPGGVLTALSAFAAAFAMRAAAWRRVLPGLSFGHALSGIHLALGANHVLPLRLGEPLRVFSVVRRAAVSLPAAASSTVALRSADFLTLLLLGLVAAPAAFTNASGWTLLHTCLALGGLPVAVCVGMWWLGRTARSNRGEPHGSGRHRDTRQHDTDGRTARGERRKYAPAQMAGRWRGMRRSERVFPAQMAGRWRGTRLPDPSVLGLSAAAWLAEAVLVYSAAHWAGLDITASEAVGVTAVSVAAQIAAVSPGGFGTYEAAAVAAYTALGYDSGDALIAALTAHALKTCYSLSAGLVAVFVPTPGVVGRLRLPRRGETGRGRHGSGALRLRLPRRGETQPPSAPAAAGTSPSGARHAVPVVLFMPAHDEQDTVAACVRRVPASVFGHRVLVLVVDDGSSDGTAERARAAGAEVIAMPGNAGLGAAVRRGLAEAVDRGAAAVAFCDADGEYDPGELETLVAPILDGEADYVAGSRFRGCIHHMRPHRRVGNMALTLALSLIARQRITDGQTGYRALSGPAAADAEIIHDYNYAQVLTLDLLSKGYRYAEIPISYRFRRTGESFIKLGRYLGCVIPAVYRQLNSDHGAGPPEPSDAFEGRQPSAPGRKVGAGKKFVLGIMYDK